jgi:Tol biopolymer transport system component
MIAHYRIIAKLGEGGMGAVYRATDTKLGRDVAIKVLPEAFAQDSGRMTRFEREAQALASLNHPNIAAIYGIEQGALIMELVEGGDLKGPFPIDTALNYARQIAEALEAAHEKGIIHRDLKPANIKVTPAGQVKLLDFGLAKATEGNSTIAGQSPTMSPTLSLPLSQAGMILGTAAYMSPEQARGKPVDKRADIWAFGVVLFELLTGCMLYGGETVSDSLAAVIARDPDWAALPKETPPRIRQLIERCLRKDPKQRMRDIGEARLIIDEQEPAPIAAAPVAERRGTWLPWAVTGLVVVAAAGAVGTVWLRPNPVNLGATRFALTIPDGNAEAGWPGGAQAAPSPDGRFLAFVAMDNSSAKHNLWVRPLGSLVAHKLDKTEGANFPFWSPDSQFIAFFADDKLKRVAVAGGSPLALCDVEAASRTFTLVSSSGDGGTWNREGVIVFSVRGKRALMRVPAAGGIATLATVPDENEVGHSWPQFLPDGRHLLYLAKNREPEKSGLYVQELGSSKRVLVLKNAIRGAWSPPGYLLFVHDSTLFAQRMNSKTFQLEGEPVSVAQEVTANEVNGRAAFAVSESGVLVYRGGLLGGLRQLAWYDREGKRLGAVGKPLGYVSVTLSPDEKSAAVVAGTAGRSDTWIMNLSSGVPTRLTLDSRSTALMGPWSPDSQRIAVNRIYGGISELTVASGKARILSSDAIYANDWSPDSSMLLCLDLTGRRLSALPLTAEAKLRTIVDTPYHRHMMRFSPGGQWVAYSSDESGRFEVFVAAFPSFAEKRQVSSGGGQRPFWRKDGREILYEALDGSLMSAEIKTGPRIDVGIPKTLFQVPLKSNLPGPDVAASGDGKRFLIVENVQSKQETQVTVVLNWTAELKQQ